MIAQIGGRLTTAVPVVHADERECARALHDAVLVLHHLEPTSISMHTDLEAGTTRYSSPSSGNGYVGYDDDDFEGWGNEGW
jgi:hypothetical protein